jgi:hypothetical protein
MEPMKPMQPMAPMRPMEPMAPMERWWPQDLGEPSSSGGQNEMRYAFFPEKQRLLVERDGQLTTYHSGGHRISGVAQQHGQARTVTFTSQDGPVDLDTLEKL